MSDYSASSIFIFIIYSLVMLYVGYWAWTKTKNSEDYFLGGRTLGVWPIALSACASGASGWLFLGLPGYAFAVGYEAFWLAAALFLGFWANWLIVAKRFRLYTVIADNALTVPAYFSNRFNDPSHLLQAVCGFFTLLFFLFYTSSGLIAGGKLFSMVFGLDYPLAVAIGAICIVSYTLFGGFLAVSWTDLIQALLMVAAFVVVPIVALQNAGGLAQVFTRMEQLNPALVDPWTDNRGASLGLIGILSLLGWSFGNLGQPHILVRFAAIVKQEQLPLARRIAVIWAAICLVGAVLIGFAGFVYVQQHLGGALEDTETIFLILVNNLFHPVIAGILLTAILAAIMSTADSQLLVCSSVLAEDFYRAFLNRDASPQTVMKIGRFAVIVITLLSLWFAYDENASIFSLLAYAWAGFGAAFGPALIASLYWRRMTRNGALAGILVGGLTVVVWRHLSGGLFDLYEMVPGVLFAWIAIVCVSLMDKPPDKLTTILFDKMKEAVQRPRLQNR